MVVVVVAAAEVGGGGGGGGAPGSAARRPRAREAALAVPRRRHFPAPRESAAAGWSGRLERSAARPRKRARAGAADRKQGWRCQGRRRAPPRPPGWLGLVAGPWTYWWLNRSNRAGPCSPLPIRASLKASTLRTSNVLGPEKSIAAPCPSGRRDDYQKPDSPVGPKPHPQSAAIRRLVMARRSAKRAARKFIAASVRGLRGQPNRATQKIR